MVIAITGHRPNKLGFDFSLRSNLVINIKQELQKRIDIYKPSFLITGMALGIDTLWATLAIENKIPFIAAIPCLNQEAKWPADAKAVYYNILNQPFCAKVYVSKTAYTPLCMQKRNIFMVENCDKLIAVWDGSKGGTENCVSYAKSIMLDIDVIDPKELK